MAKLQKLFETRPDYYGFTNRLEIECDFNEEENSIDNLEVYCHSGRHQSVVRLTSIFETVPELVSLVDNIDWNEIARQEELAKEEEVCDAE